MRTLLLSMPFGAVDRPALGISLLKAGLIREGLACDLAYPLELLVSRIGLDDYKWLTDEVPYTTFAGDWCFTLPLYGRRPDPDWAYVTNILRDNWQLGRRDIARVVRVREVTPAFLDDCLAACDWDAYDIVGFTSTFVQNLASLSLAQRLKAHHPHLRIVFGGANWEGEMGAALFEAFPFVDHVCQGEADESFPAMVKALAAGQSAPRIPGVLSRGGNAPPAIPIGAMDRIPIPDFDDFFAMHRRIAPAAPPHLLMETSRGCWWGAKHHCTFCGLNGQGMGFRAKSAGRVLAEIDELVGRYGTNLLSMVDNILDMRFFDTLIPALEKLPRGPAIFYETKANLSRRQVGQLSRANVFTIQPGIESLSNRVLKLMRKGTTGIRNVQLLKWCRELNVSVEWNVLYGFPGETDADYEGMLALMPCLAHLQPPSGCGPVRIDRFSPYYETPGDFGLRALRPLTVFNYLYPFAAETQARIACYFEADYEASCASPATVARIHAAIDAWRMGVGDSLRVRDTGKALHIRDARSGRQVDHLLVGVDRLVYLALDRCQSVAGIGAALERAGAAGVAETAITAFLDRLVAAELAIEEEGHYLALGVYDRFPAGWEETSRAASATLVEAYSP